MKELIKILMPAIKSYKEWNGDDKKALMLFSVLIILFFIGGLIEGL